MSSEHRFQIRNDEATALMRKLADEISAKLPPDWGFTLMIFEFDPGNSLFYISNAQREHIVKVMKEWIARNTN